MALYLAYGVLVMHVALGVMQEDRRVFIPLLLGGSFALVTLLHFAAAGASARPRRSMTAGSWSARRTRSPTRRARIVAAPDGERIAVFRDGDQIGALTNVCAHQNGPIGEGCIINGSSPARGTATSTGWRTAARRRRSPRSSRPIGSGCATA